MASKKELHYEPSVFPAFDFGYVLPPKVTSAKVKNAEIRGSLSAAIYLASQIELAQGSIRLRVEPIRSAYFRAALSEIVRVEDIAKASKKNFKFTESHDPLLHIIKLLRNYQVHVGVFKLEAGSIGVQHGDAEGIYESFIVDNLSVKERIEVHGWAA